MEYHCNLEVLWPIKRLAPDFRAIGDYRKDKRTKPVDIGNRLYGVFPCFGSLK